jgi:TolB-like protein/DNA-binding winged helix-turn-helix (wHTH) protein
MSPTHLKPFQLGPWTVDPLGGAVTGPDGETQHLEPKVMDVLVCLAGHAGELVTRQQLLETVWNAGTGSDEQLTRAIGELRRAFGDSPGDSSYIETVPKRGYRLTAEVRTKPGNTDSAALPGSAARPPGRRLVATAATVLVLALIYIAFNRTENDAIPDASVASGKSIAVLPFVNLSDDAGNEYFSDGLSEEILNLLARVPGLKVIGRTSSFSFKGKPEDLREIGRALGVTNVLEGSVFKAGEQVRITTQLVDVSDGSTIWSDQYDRTMTDIFAVQDEIAAAILDELKIHVGKPPVRRQPTKVTEAYVQFLKARATLVNQDDVKQGEIALLRAIKLDPKFAEAHELLAHLYWTAYIPGIPIPDTRRLMRDQATAALAIDPSLPLARALYLMGNADNFSSPDVIEALESAARERPNDPAILRTLTWELLIAGYLQDALRAAERYVDIDPLSSVAHIRYSTALRAVGRIPENLAEFKAAAALTPDNLDWYFGELALYDHDDEAAIEYMEEYLRREGYTYLAWVRDLVTRGRDPASGQAYLDEHIPAIVQSAPPEKREDLRVGLNILYLLFGYLDRYFDIILETLPDDFSWTGVDMYVWYGTVFRDGGFTAHPKYLEVAEWMGLTDVWDRRGPPDYCSKVEGRWVCE